MKTLRDTFRAFCDAVDSWAIREATEAGRRACTRGVKLFSVPYRSKLLRDAWVDGWLTERFGH